MHVDQDDPAQARARELWLAGDMAGAATLVIEAYGPGILRLVHFVSRTPALGDEAWSEFLWDLWRGIPAFQWRCPIRAWCFVLAHKAAGRVGRSHARRARHELAITLPPQLEPIAVQTRTSTAPYLRSEVRERFGELLDTLTDEQRQLIMLRVEQRLPWDEVAAIVYEWDEPPAERDRERAVAALRQRYRQLKKLLIKQRGPLTKAAVRGRHEA